MASLTAVQPDDSDSVVFTELLRRIGQCVGFALAGGALGLVVGGFAASLEPATYVSSVRIWVRDVPRSLDVAYSERQRVLSVDTEAQRILSSPVLSRAGVTDPRSVTVSAIPTSTVLQVRVEAHDPEQARQEASSLAAAYLDARREFLIRRRSDTANEMTAQVSRLGAGLRDSRTTGATQRWRDALNRQLKTQAEVSAAGVQPGRILSAASPPRRARADRLVQVVSGAVLGGIAGYALGYAYAVFRRQGAP